MWQTYFKHIFLINCKFHEERLRQSCEELNKYGIRPTIVTGTYDEVNPENGILQTTLNLIKANQSLDRILVFEDDVKFCVDPNLVMDNCVRQLMERPWHMFYLGVNTHEKFKEKAAPNLLPIRHGYGLHAVAYSKEGMKEILKQPAYAPIDVMLADKIQTLNKSYCSYPMIATQRNGYSTIQKTQMDQSYIERRFYDNVKHLH